MLYLTLHAYAVGLRCMLTLYAVRLRCMLTLYAVRLHLCCTLHLSLLHVGYSGSYRLNLYVCLDLLGNNCAHSGNFPVHFDSAEGFGEQHRPDHFGSLVGMYGTHLCLC
jgi:hypothetical protein